MGGSGLSGGPSSKPARALGKAVVGTLLATAARRFRDREAFFCAGTGRRFSFGQTNERCNRLAHGLAGLGLVKPDTIAFLCNNRAEVPETYYALAKAGLVGIPLNYRLAPVEIVALMSAMGAKAMLFETRFTAVAEKVRAELPQVKSFVVIGGNGPAWASEYEDLLVFVSRTRCRGRGERPLLLQSDLRDYGLAQVIRADPVQQCVCRADV